MLVVPLIGSRVRVWWTEEEGEEAWFGGRVFSVERSAGGSLHTTVAYDDDSTETHDLESPCSAFSRCFREKMHPLISK